MPHATINGLSLNYEVTQSGAGHDSAPVLLIMGFCIRGAGWRFVVPALAERHAVCTYDNRGCGLSDVPEPGYGMGDMADDAVALMDHLGWERAHVVGVSMGGMIAQHVGLRHRNRVSSLSLVATSAGSFLGRVPSPKGLVHVIGGAVRGKNEDATMRSLIKLLFPRNFQEELGRDWLTRTLNEDLTPRPTAMGRKGQLKAIFGHDTRKRLGELKGLPTVIVKPERDLLIRPKQSELLHRLIPGSSIVRLPEFGHGLVRHAGERLSQPLLDHFAAVDHQRHASGAGEPPQEPEGRYM